MTQKQVSLLFLDYYLKTARFSFDSSGENIGLSDSKIFDKFKATMKSKPLITEQKAQCSIATDDDSNSKGCNKKL